MPSPIGGFFGLAPGEAAAGSGADFGEGRALLFWNARAALAHLFSALDARRVWLPAYICTAAADAAARDGRDIVFYGVGADLRPDTAALAAGVRSGDAVLGVDYFGAPDAALAALAPRFADIAWIEDRAQGLWPAPAPAPWGAHVIYSPRKVLGAPDGGVLLSRSAPLPPPVWAADPDQGRLEPARLRAADPDGRNNAVWYAAYQAAEAAMTCEPRPMSEVSAGVLAAADTAAIADRRRANAELLLARAGEAALIPAERLLAAAPLGVPVLTPDAAAASRRMAAQRIFCARHWAELPSPAADFPAEHDLSRRLLTLPCDQRYDAADMARVADAFLDVA
jgi:hypothetical protein